LSTFCCWFSRYDKQIQQQLSRPARQAPEQGVQCRCPGTAVIFHEERILVCRVPRAVPVLQGRRGDTAQRTIYTRSTSGTSHQYPTSTLPTKTSVSGADLNPSLLRYSLSGYHCLQVRTVLFLDFWINNSSPSQEDPVWRLKYWFPSLSYGSSAC